MRFHLLTSEGAQRIDDVWQIAPSVPLHNLPSTLMMPMTGDEIELRLPDGRVITAHIASFGVDVWKDSEGNFYTNSDFSDPSLTLTITCDADLEEMPPGTEVWLSNATFSSASDA